MIPNYFCLETQAHEKFYEKSSGLRTELHLPENAVPGLRLPESGCKLEETINYECPILLYPLCKSEVYSQRSKVLHNLKIEYLKEIFS